LTLTTRSTSFMMRVSSAGSETPREPAVDQSRPGARSSQYFIRPDVNACRYRGSLSPHA
jgi:hypothetical protein